jgi:glucokinase
MVTDIEAQTCRNPTIMSDVNQPPYWLGFDLGGTKMLAKVFDRISRDRPRTQTHQRPRRNQERLERIQKTIRGALESTGIQPGDLGGIGVGFPGPVDMDRALCWKRSIWGGKKCH